MRAPALHILGLCLGAMGALTTLSACVDAPITADQLQADGTLRGGYAGGMQHAALSAEPGQVAQAVRVSAVLAPQSEGPLEDRAEFDADVGTVYLHVRADGLLSSRRVVYRWKHDAFVVEVPGTLVASDAMALGTSFDIAPEQSGHWEVDVLADTADQAPGSQPRVLFHREFVVNDPAL